MFTGIRSGIDIIPNILIELYIPDLNKSKVLIFYLFTTYNSLLYLLSESLTDLHSKDLVDRDSKDIKLPKGYLYLDTSLFLQ